MNCDACPAPSVGTLTLHPSGRSLNLCGHHLRSTTTALDERGAEYEVVYRAATV